MSLKGMVKSTGTISKQKCQTHPCRNYNSSQQVRSFINEQSVNVLKINLYKICENVLLFFI